MRRRNTSRLRGYLIACVCTLTAFWARYLADDYVGTVHVFSTFYAAVAITAWLAGTGPALLAMGLGYLVCDYFFISPRGSLSLLKFHTSQLAGLTTYLFVCGVIIATNEALRRARRREHELLRRARRQSLEHRRLIDREQTARAETEEMHRILKEREEYRLMGEAVPYGLWKCDPAGKILYVSQSLLDLVGMNLDEVQQFGWLRLLPREDARPIRDRWLRSMRTGEPWEAELRVTGNDGIQHYVLSRGRPVRDNHGAITSWVGINLDIDERKRAYAELERLQAELSKQLAELAEVDRRKDRFLSMLGHELRNPIAAICGAVDVLGLLGPFSADVDQMLAVLGRQSVHLTRLVDDLLDVSRINEGKILLKYEHLDVNEVVRSTVNDYEASRDASGCHLSLHLSESPMWIEADRVRLTQIIGNLLHNAYKFAAGAKVWVEVLTEENHKAACLVVRDSGVGMNAEVLARVFEPFSQGDKSLDRSQGGLGLGLAVVKGLVELHGGYITAASAGPAQGAEFRACFPLAQHEPIRPQPFPAPAKKAFPLRILLVEDQPDAARAAERLLTLHGHEVAVASDGSSALETAIEVHPDVILCDIGLPGAMDGYAVAGAVRQHSQLANIYLVALTGYGRDEDRRQALAAGFDEHLVKPLDIERLDYLLAAMVERRTPIVPVASGLIEQSEPLHRVPR